MYTLAAFDLEWPPHRYEAYADFFSADSWVEISSQPSSSSLSSANDEVVTTGLRVQQTPRRRRRRVVNPGAPSTLHITTRASDAEGTSSQDEYEESESESDRVMTSSGEGPYMQSVLPRSANVQLAQANPTHGDTPHESSDDENRTAINYPIRNHETFTPQPNAFTHPPSAGNRSASQTVPGSYFPVPSTRPPPRSSPSSHRNSLTGHHLPQNILSPSYNAAAHHDEALRSSLNTLLSCAAAARNLAKPNSKAPQQQAQAAPRGNRVDPMSFRLIPESALPSQNHAQIFPQSDEPTFKPTLRRTSTSTTSTSPSPLDRITKEATRRKTPTSKSRRTSPAKKARHSQDPAAISPTLFTWVVSAGVVVVLSALSFSAGYSLGREAGLMEANGSGAGLVDVGMGREAGCAREVAGRSMGLKRSLARGAVQV